MIRFHNLCRNIKVYIYIYIYIYIYVSRASTVTNYKSNNKTINNNT